MSFSLERTHISGGTFNNVSGNMSQVNNSYVAVPAGQQVIDGAQRLLPTSAESTGVVGPQRAGRHIRNVHRPYDIPVHRLIYPPEAGSSGIEDNGGRASNLRITPSNAPFHNPSPRAPGYGANIPTHPQTFNSIGGDMHQLEVNVTSYGESGIDTLYRFIAIEALHNSGERFQEPACHPGTRTAILAELDTWSRDTSPTSQLLWLHGSAGAGKSAIAQMFAGDCDTQGRLGASFFFRRGHPKRGTWQNLITTIAYQLANSVPELQLPIQQAVESDKPIVGRALAVQFQQLLVEPFRNVTALRSQPIIILDGLDECDDHKIQQQILRLFISAIRVGSFPARILICSRPEPHLREVLETPEMSGMCRHSMLSADKVAFDDIRTYLRDEFARIHSEYAGRGINLGAPWPTPETLQHLVKQSSGVFIYATTVIRFVDDEYSHPCDQLESVLKLDPHSTAPLDDLYTQILSVLPHTQQSLRILHAVWQGTLPETMRFDPEEIDLLLGLRSGTCHLALRGLNSLLCIPSVRMGWAPRERVTYLHASFGDYISNSHRSQQWCVSIPWLKSDYVHSMVRMLSLPPSTFSIRGLYRQVVKELPRALLEEQPTEALITLLRGQNFQNSLFLEVCFPQWPQRESSYPLDLIRLWEEHSFISALASEVISNRNQGAPTRKYDWIYAKILGIHSDLLFVLRYLLVTSIADILDLSGLTYRVLQPFLQFREFLDLPLPKGDSPLDFLSDPCRAVGLYRDNHDIAEEAMMLYISRAKEVLLGTSDIEFYGYMLTDLLEQCPTSSKLLDELQSLDLRQLCDHHAANEASHYRVHDVLLYPSCLNSIVDWLWKFPDPPLHAIAFWKSQIADVEKCIKNNDFKYILDEDTDEDD